MASFPEFARIFCSLSLLLVASHSVGRMFVLLRQPRVIGEIVGGLLLGPTLLGWMVPEATSWLFPKTGPLPTVLSVVSQVGLILLMYASGSQLRSFIAPGEKKVVALISLTGTLLPLLAGLGYLQFVDSSDLVGSAQNNTAFVLVFATAIAIASIPVISRIMLDLGIMETAFARIVIATAVIDDMLLYVVLAVALGMVSSGAPAQHGLLALAGLDPASHFAPLVHVLATVLLIATTLFAGPLLWRWALRLENRFVRWDNAAVIHAVFLAIVGGSCLLLDVNALFGALAAGMVSASITQRSGFGSPRSIPRASLAFFIPLYFALVGVRLDLIHHFEVVYFLEFLGFACVVKAASIYAGARAAGESHSAAVNLAAALNARGGPGIVLAAVSYEAGIINENFFAILVLVAIVTSMAAGSWLGRVVRSGVPLRAMLKPWSRSEAAAPAPNN